MRTPTSHSSEHTDRVREFSGPGFALVRGFLWWILFCVAGLGVVGLAMSWHFGMDVSVQARGRVVPARRWPVKAEIGALLQRVVVRQGMRVEVGQVLAVLDGSEWQVALRKVEKDLQASESRRLEVELGLERARRLGEAELARAHLEVRRAALHLEAVRAEESGAYASVLVGMGWKRKPLEELLPVRQARAALAQRRAERVLAEVRLHSLEGQRQQMQTLSRAAEKLRAEREWLRARLERTQMRAPMAGTVLTDGLEERVGDRLQAGQVLLELAGLDGWLVEVEVGALELPKVRPGQQARVYVDAYPHMEYGIFPGTVQQVALEPLAGGAGYRVKVGIDDARVAEGKGGRSLAYGMEAEARIVVERGRILQVLWRRFLRSLGKVDRREIYALSGEGKP